MEETVYDIVIVGGGISGLYTAWRLANATQLKVLVLEGSSRFGGRYRTCTMPGGFPADLGAMRYLPEAHRILHHLVTTLQLETDSMEKLAENVNHSFGFYLRNQHMSSLEEVQKMYSISEADLPYFLSINQFYFPDQRKPIELEVPENRSIPQAKVKGLGQAAKDTSVAQYLLQSNNAELLNFGQCFYPPLSWPVDVAAAKINWLLKSWSGVQKLKDGFSAIVAGVVENLSKHPNIETRLKHKVLSIREDPSGFVIDAGNDTQQFKAKQLIYACTQEGIRHISLNSEICDRKHLLREMLDKVNALRQMKMFLTYRKAWWEDQGFYQGARQTDLPIQYIVAFGESAKSSEFATIMASFTFHSIEVFEGLDAACHERFKPEVGNVPEDLLPSRRLVDNVHEQLKIVLGCPEYPEKPISAVRMFWGNQNTGPVSYYPKVGVDSNQLHWQSLKPFADSNLFITGDIFAAWEERGNLIGFSESALLTSERLLVNYFDLEPVIDNLCLTNPWP